MTRRTVSDLLSPVPSCTHANIVPYNEHWAKCMDCGDDTFPISDEAAGLVVDDEPLSPCIDIEAVTVAGIVAWLRDGRAYAFHVSAKRRAINVDAALAQLAEAIEQRIWKTK